MRMVILKRKMHNLYKEICKRRLALLLFYLVNSDILAFIIFYNMVSLIKDVDKSFMYLIKFMIFLFANCIFMNAADYILGKDADE